MHRFIKTFGKIFTSVVFTVGFFISQGTCYSLYYQPDMPPEMAKKLQ